LKARSAALPRHRAGALHNGTYILLGGFSGASRCCRQLPAVTLEVQQCEENACIPVQSNMEHLPIIRGRACIGTSGAKLSQC
jgi:hypothetical protein